MLREDPYPTVQWYEDIQEIRKTLSVEQMHLEKIRKFDHIRSCSLADINDVTVVDMFITLLLSYPVLAANHRKEWEDFREFCGMLTNLSKERFMPYLRSCVTAVVNRNRLELLKNAANPEIRYFNLPFDYMDKVVTLKENKSKMPFQFLEYDENMLIRVVETISELNIKDVIDAWFESHPSDVYAEVRELYKILRKGRI